MTKHNAQNERIKRDYVRYLEEAKRRDGTTIDRVLASIARFEEATRRRDFKAFHKEQAVAFKRRLSETLNARTGERLSKATIHSTLRDLQTFFFWLADRPGYKSHIEYTDGDYFNLSNKDVAIATARREKRVPTLAQVEHALGSMPSSTPVERRDRAVLAFAVITGARVAALASFRIGDVNLDEGYIDQDARHVRTKFGKTFRTFFMPVSEVAMTVAAEWYAELNCDPLRGPQDPLFPTTEIGRGDQGGFASLGLANQGWRTSEPIRKIFRKAFEAGGLSYFNPHCIRDMLVRHIMTQDLPVETLKSWSQNLGHEGLLTTLTSYGSIPTDRQGELIRQGLRKADAPAIAELDPKLIAAVVNKVLQIRSRDVGGP